MDSKKPNCIIDDPVKLIAPFAMRYLEAEPE